VAHATDSVALGVRAATDLSARHGVGSPGRPAPADTRRDRMHTFRIVTTDGRELGPMALGRPDWPVGSVIYQGGPQPNLRVVGQRDTEPGDPVVLVVEET